MDRLCCLWPETVTALKAVHANRPAPLDPEDDELVFLTEFGRPWVRYHDRGDDRRGVPIDAVGPEFRKLAKRTQVKMPGSSDTLRHVFRTVCDPVPDRVAIDTVMGHVDDSVASFYRHEVGDVRIKAVTGHVRAWFLSGRKKSKAAD